MHPGAIDRVLGGRVDAIGVEVRCLVDTEEHFLRSIIGLGRSKNSIDNRRFRHWYP